MKTSEKMDKGHTWEGFVPTKHSRVCSRHFHESCYQLERNNENVTRLNNNTSKGMRLAKLNPNAVPAIFPGVPAYLSDLPPRPRYAAVTTEKNRVEQENQRLQQKITSFMEKDQTCDDIRKNIDRLCIPQKIHDVYEEDFAIFFSFSTLSGIPQMSYGLKILRDLSFDIS
nr:uncharacterized protein LOC121130444 [Lepeophtheirus salmonis]